MKCQAYDPDRFDAEIKLDRTGLTAPFTVPVLCTIFKCSRAAILRAKYSGKIPQPFVAGDKTSSDLWTHEQVLDMLMGEWRPGKPGSRDSEIEHGTARGYQKEWSRGLPICDACLEAKRAANRLYKSRAKAAA